MAYARFREGGGPAWPVPFWLHAAAREHHLHQRLAGIRLPMPVATAARDHATSAGLSPAEAVWHLHGSPTGLLRLADLSAAGHGRAATAS